ncbi:MAG TPA: P-II family nitrogen regulator [Ferruginibacter sp.]|jgi:nitrogen regulatory protein P-II 1|nr:P-II family nitrogen regulator [Ferruginibacter sp.]
MKKIEAIVRTSKFEDVKLALKENGIDFFSYWEAAGVGNEITRGHHSYRGTVYDTQYIPRIFISIVLREINVQKTINCIEKAAFTGEIGDGMIFTYAVEESIRISNGARGEASTQGPSDTQ